MAISPDLLESGGVGEARTPNGRRWSWLLLLVLVLTLAVGGTAWSGDRRELTREAAAVSTCERHLRQATALAERRMGLLAHYVQPALRTTQGVQQLHLADLMADRAGQVLPGVQRADRECRALSIRSWHFSLVARRDAAQAYSAALVTLLQTIAAQGRVAFHDDSVLLRLRLEAGVD